MGVSHFKVSTGHAHVSNPLALPASPNGFLLDYKQRHDETLGSPLSRFPESSQSRVNQ